MESKKVLLPVVGRKLVGDFQSWALIGLNKDIITVEYYPAFELLYPKGSSFPCLLVSKSSISRYEIDWEEVYSNIYEEDCEYVFDAIQIEEDPRGFTKKLLVRDEYGFDFYLYRPSKEDLSKVGGRVVCRVETLTNKGLILESTTGGNKEDEEARLVSESLFDKLHDARVDAFKVLNDRDFRGVWQSVIDKYPDTAHFIYELLQNADDALATEVSFILSSRSLIFKHNGTIRFSVTDVENKAETQGHINSITGIGDTTKIESVATNKIGKFGIGFKSVFQYTDAPEIYDDLFCFKIVNYIVPERISTDHNMRDPGETLFVIPFKNPQVAYKDISAKLKSLANGTLFLHNLTKIRWRDLDTKESRQYSKTILESISSNNGILLEKLSLADYDKKRDVLMFSRILDLGADGNHRINVGYYLKADGTIDTNANPGVYCFFPTSESFNRCMITHAPFRLVDNRQQIKPGEPVNKRLVEELGRLVADSLCELRDLGIREGHLLLNENIERIIRWNDYHPYSFSWKDTDKSIIQAAAIVEPCIARIKDSELLLSSDQKYLRGPQSYKLTPKYLASLITTEQLRQLRKTSEAIGILCESLNDTDFYSIDDDIELNTYITSDFASDITPEFMKAQPVAWINRFFTFLNNRVRESWNPEERNPFFLKAPIVETVKGEWVPPYIDGRINVFSEGDAEQYNVISETMLDSKPAMKFLSDIGCKEPDMLDHIINHVLTKYLDEEAEFEEEEILDDFTLVLKYYNTAPLEARETLLEKAENKFLIGAKSSSGVEVILPPGEVYLDNDDLKKYFRGDDNVYFFDSVLYGSIIHGFGRDLVDDFLLRIGILTSPAIVKTISHDRSKLGDYLKEQITSHYSSRPERDIITDYTLQGLQMALSRINDKADALCFWRLISSIPTKNYATGTYEFFYRQSHVAQFDSTAIVTLKTTRWIIINGKKLRPNDVSLEEFIDEHYEVNYDLCNLLGIKRRKLDLVEAHASQEQIENEALGALARSLNIDEETMIQMAAELKKREKKRIAAEQREEQKGFLYDNWKELTSTGDNSFITSVVSSKSTKPSDLLPIERQEVLQEQKEKVLNDIARKEALYQLRNTVNELPKYSKEWFEALLELEYKNDEPNDNSMNSQAISISFGKVVPDVISDRIIILKNPSKPIPIAIETIERIEVRFEFKDKEDKSIVFEVASVRDFTLRLKAKAADARLLSTINWDKCTRATVSANNPTELMGKLISAYKELEIEDGFDFKENLQDNISFVFGPPGTGKTTFVARRIFELMKKEDYCKILVLAPTNKACDVITEKIAAIADYPSWLGRFVATGSDIIENSDLLCNRDSELDEEDKCCLVSTIARLPYDGFLRSSGASRLKDIDWNYVIIDEASMIPLAQIVYAIYRFSPYANIIIAGDPLQIPPITNEPAWEDENIYTMVHLDRFDNPITEPIQFEITNLTTQYRSVPVIGEVYSRYSYNGQLQHHRSQDDRVKVNIEGLDFKPINFIQFRVDKYDNVYGPKKLSSSSVQIYSVLLVTEICKYITTHYVDGKVLNIGIICPYAAESQMIERLIEQVRDIPESIRFNVGTIHGFQGDECDMVFVVFNPPKSITTQADRIMLNKKHIINVAISRARDYLFLLIPHRDTEGYANLREINTLGRIIIDTCPGHYQYYTSDDIEKILFGRTRYIEENTFVTSHQMANVYTETGVKYEVRIDDYSVDIQISDTDHTLS